MKKEKIAFVFATYTLSDPTTRNTINSISNLFDKIIVVEQNSSIKYKPLESKNIVVEQVSDLSGFPGLMGIKNVFKWITYKLTVKKLIKKYNPGLLITFMLKPLAAIKLLPGQIMISCIYDIPDPQTAGKMDGVINKRGFLNLKNAQVVWASDEYKAALTAEFGKLNTLPLVCYNCPVLKTDDYDVASAKLWLREKLRQSGATVSETGGTVLVRAGAIGPYGGIEETLSAMTALPENCIFLMMGRPDKEYG